MENAERRYLQGKIALSRKPDGSSPIQFFVSSVIGEGGSSVCYEASRTLDDGISVETGKLKEFYPVESSWGEQHLYYSMERLKNGQLVPGVGTVRKFDEMCEDYISAYRTLNQVMADNPDNEILKRYIQHGEILYGIADADNPSILEETFPFLQKKNGLKATIYIWSPGVAGKKFSDYLAEVRKKPGSRPENTLRDILNVIYKLTDSIKAMHTAGLMHLDIKPSNFLVQYDSDFKIDTGTISLFDVNTLCSVESDYIRVSGTEGFCAPEIYDGEADNRSDIYSIGAMLFNAIVMTDEIPDGLYRDSYYGRINQLVKHSALFEVSDINSEANLMSKVCRILEKCLAADPWNRYQSCTELRADFVKVIERLSRLMLLPSAQKKEGAAEPTIAVQKLLYEHPLYESVPEGISDINVLVIGSGIYSQKFIDHCLQSGQMSGTNLNITALSEEPDEYRSDYLRFRPALNRFVNINGSLAETDLPAYATLDFMELSDFPEGEYSEFRFSRSKTKNEELADQIVRMHRNRSGNCHYVFIEFEDDQISSSTARRFSETIEKLQGNACPVCYTTWKRIRKDNRASAGAGKKATIHKLYPVCIGEPLQVTDIDANLREMAFNTHISWDETFNMNVTGKRDKFFNGKEYKDKYNRSSSLAFVLSVKYKLHSIQIDCENLSEAAKEFSVRVLEARSSDEEARKKFDCLVDLEHRRWLIEKAVDGWSAPLDNRGRLCLKDCITRGSVKDNDNRTHPCMVRGSESSPLNSPEYTQKRTLWDEGEIDPSLDELDRMSIELHRCFRVKADEIKRESLYQNQDLIAVQNFIPAGCKEAEQSFRQFQFALKNIVNGVESYSRQYKEYQKALTDSLKILSEEKQMKLKERLAVISHTFFPVIECNLYRNYKANDEVLVEKIPFILTHRYKRSIAMAFEDDKFHNGRNEAVFADVAAPTMLSPERIVYLYWYDRDSDLKLLIRKLDAVIHYFGKREVHCGIELVAACSKEVSDEARRNLRNELTRLRETYTKSKGNAWFENEVICDTASCRDASAEFINYLQDHPVDLFEGENQLFPTAMDNAMFIWQVTNLKIPYFEFDWRYKRFTRHEGCEYLRYVQDKSFIRINDMFSLMNAVDNRFNLPEFAEDYEALWEIYTGSYLPSNVKKFDNGVENWNRLCDCLKKYEDEQKPLAEIPICEKPEPFMTTFVRFLPSFSFGTVKRLLQCLIEYGLVEPKSSLVNHTSDTCKLTITTDQQYEKSLQSIFNKPQFLLSYYEPEASRYQSDEGKIVKVSYNNPEVSDIDLEKLSNGNGKHVYDVLDDLYKKNFITNLKHNNDYSKVNFVYTSPRIKRLLTSSGEILKIYAYYEILKTGYFDDVAAGYEFCWEEGDVTNELDLVLTKGFRSIIVECKAVKQLELEHYHKLHSIADQFGVGTMKVLLGNTYDHSNLAAEDNNMIQKSRGNQMNIETISEEDRIRNIGQTMISLMEK